MTIVTNMEGASTKDGATAPPQQHGGAVSESLIRKMTRLSESHGAVNLSQGFPNEPPPLAVRAALAKAVLLGDVSSKDQENVVEEEEEALSNLLSLVTALQTQSGSETTTTTDTLNQYSPPMGRPDVRRAVASYYRRLYGYDGVDAECGVTITLGATEACAVALRTLGQPGEQVVVLEPFHELYAHQCQMFYLQPLFVTLREVTDEDHEFTQWTLDMAELEAAVSQNNAKILLLNTPHNPTGKVFSHEELSVIVDLCVTHGVTIVTDDIYEHMTYTTPKKHVLLPQAFPHAKDHIFVCNSIGKSASATGWRLGWCLHPPHSCAAFRGIHDQMVIMAPHPMQYAALTFLALDPKFFRQTLATRYVARLQLLTQTLSQVGFSSVHALPEGAYYVFCRYRSVPALAALAPMEAALYLVSQVGVACVPGDNFYGSPQGRTTMGTQYLRFAACRSMTDMTQACERLRAAFLPTSSSSEASRGTAPA